MFDIRVDLSDPDEARSQKHQSWWEQDNLEEHNHDEGCQVYRESRFFEELQKAA
jgi:hypothetical protein